MSETFRGIAVGAPGMLTGRPRTTTRLDIEIVAPAKPLGASTLRVDGIVGRENFFNTMLEGNGSPTGARITVLVPGVRLFVRVGGLNTCYGVSPGNFKALYRLWWA